MFKLLFRAWWAVLFLPIFHSYAAEDETTDRIVVNFCAPANDAYPFFIIKNDKLAGINPDLVRQIFGESTLSNVTLQFIKRPWKRCNAELESGIVDMMIGGFDPKRDNVVYPSRLGFRLEDSAVSVANVCFSSIAGSQMERTRKGMQGQGTFTVGIQAGFSKQHSDKINPQWVELYNPIEKYKMLEKGRVDAIVQVCAMDNDYPIETKSEVIGFTNFEPLYPPYLSNPAYVVFSENFADKHRELAKRIVTLSSNIDKTAVYSRYKPKH